MEKSAVISECGKYRYQLDRRWDKIKPWIVFCMLNPSTADASIDDPTIRRVMTFAMREGSGAVRVVNLFGLRATSPKELTAAFNAYGSENETYLANAAKDSAMTGTRIVCAWGAHGDLDDASNRTVALFKRHGARLSCLGRTKHGLPRHPLYLKVDTALESM